MALTLLCCECQVHGREFCSFINQALRDDIEDHLQDLVPVVRAINTLCVGRDQASKGLWPSDGICFRGGALPDKHLSFFTVGKKYRVPGFLATSFKEKVSMEFAHRSTPAHLVEKQPMVLWQIKVVQDCVQVNYVSHSNVSKEEEFLFAPFSTFSVEAVELSPDPKLQPHRIHLVAAQDNRAEPEDLPLAPWY